MHLHIRAPRVLPCVPGKDAMLGAPDASTAIRTRLGTYEVDSQAFRERLVPKGSAVVCSTPQVLGKSSIPIISNFHDALSRLAQLFTSGTKEHNVLPNHKLMLVFCWGCFLKLLSRMNLIARGVASINPRCSQDTPSFLTLDS
eukprot:1169697-Amphidinium_carterae.1